MRPVLPIALAISLGLLVGCEAQEPGMEEEGTAMEEQQAEAPATAPETAQVASFSSLDQDGDGAITQEEAQGLPQLVENFTQVDRNQDGRVDEAEFAQFETQLETGTMPQPGAMPEPAPGGQTGAEQPGAQPGEAPETPPQETQ